MSTSADNEAATAVTEPEVIVASATTEVPEAGENPVSKGPTAALGLFLVVLLLLGLGNAAAVYVLWQGGKSQTEKLARLDSQAERLAAVEATAQAASNNLASLQRGSQAQWQDLQQQQRQQQQALAEVQTKLELIRSTNAELREKVEAGAAAWRLDAVEQLLLTANERLFLAADARGAEQALKLADDHLQAIADPVWLDLRQQIAADIAALRSVPVLDTTAVNLKLQALDQRAQNWPLAGHVRLPPAAQTAGAKAEAADAQGPWHQKLMGKVQTAVLALVTVRQVDAPTAPLMPPEQHGRLQQNLRLQFEQARTSLLLRNPGHYQASLRSAADWISRYYDRDDPAVQAALSTLTELRAVDVAPRMPDISQSLRVLRQTRAGN